jgi:hypothetical protein
VAGGWPGALDLAAMPVTPQDMTDLGLPGFGRFFNGYYASLDELAGDEARFIGKSVEETRALYGSIGFRRFYGTGMGVPSVPGDPASPPERGVIANVLELDDVPQLDDYVAFYGTAGPETEMAVSVAETPWSLGERGVIFSNSAVDPERGERYEEFMVVFQFENLMGMAGFFRVIPVDTATPEATPAVGGASALLSPAATLEELESLSTRLLERMQQVLDAGSPNLPSLLLRLGDDPLVATANYTEGYRLLDGELIPSFNDFQDDILADPAAVTGADAIYELEESFMLGEEPAPGDPFLLNRLYHFPDDASAIAFMDSRPDALATGGAKLATGAGPETRSDLLPGEATDLGDQSMAFSFVRDFDGNRAEGYEVYVRVGDMIAAVSLEGPSSMPLDQVADIAAAQAACLEAGACPDALPVPEALLTGFGTLPAATPEASPER